MKSILARKRSKRTSLGDDCTFTGAKLSVDPLFVNSGSGDYRLAVGSPLIEAGMSPDTFSGDPCLDFEGKPRLLDGDSDGIAYPDIGGIEFEIAAPSVPEVTDIGFDEFGRMT